MVDAENTEPNKQSTSSDAIPPKTGSSTHNRLQPRRSLFSVASETIRYIERAEKDQSAEVRTDDKKSVIFMSLSFVIAVIFTLMYMFNQTWRPACIGLALVSDLLLGLSILWYVLLRFGVLRSVEPRHALLSWQLMLGAGALFAFYTMNVAFAFFTFYTSSQPAQEVQSQQKPESESL